MRRSIALLAVFAAAFFLVLTTAVPAASAADGPKYFVPASSIENPEDIGVRAHTNIMLVLNKDGQISRDPAPINENPASLACIYQLVKKTKGCPRTATILPNGGTRAIALVDAFDNPDAATDLTTFATAYGYGTPNFTKVKVGNPGGNSGWALEESLDIEYAFGMAPNAQIILVEANSNSFADLEAAEEQAVNLLQAAGGGQASNSWGGSEFSGEKTHDRHFKGADVVFFASSGDAGGQVSYPSSSPNLISVGGTRIERDSKGNFTSEIGWNSGGGGPSQFEPRPKYQDGVQSIVGSHRGTPDVSSQAAVVEIYSQFGCGGYCAVAGTSISSPTWAGIVNAAGKFRSSTRSELTTIYNDYADSTKYAADFTDITSGTNSYTCKTGYEFCTGIGTPKTFKGK